VAGAAHATAANVGSAVRAELDDHAGDRPALVVLGLCLVALGVVEVVLIAQGYLLAGQIADGVLLLVLLNFRGRGRAPAAMRALALVALARVFGAGLPLARFSEPLGELVISLVVGLVAIRVAPTLGINVRRIVRARVDRSVVAAFVVGGLLGLLAYLLGAPSLLPARAGADRTAVAVAAAIIGAVAEELVFRGLVQTTLQGVAGRIGLVAATALFACTYVGAGSAELVLTFVLAGLVFALALARTGVLTGAIAGHLALSIGAFVVWPAVLGRAPSVEFGGWITTTALALLMAAATLAAVRRSPVAPRGWSASAPPSP
jgi:membrane protease YdiL (CAAX protease family)